MGPFSSPFPSFHGSTLPPPSSEVPSLNPPAVPPFFSSRLSCARKCEFCSEYLVCASNGGHRQRGQEESGPTTVCGQSLHLRKCSSRAPVSLSLSIYIYTQRSRSPSTAASSLGVVPSHCSSVTPSRSVQKHKNNPGWVWRHSILCEVAMSLAHCRSTPVDTLAG